MGTWMQHLIRIEATKVTFISLHNKKTIILSFKDSKLMRHKHVPLGSRRSADEGEGSE